MKKIKNIIFDLGGVFIDIDYSKTERAFTELGIINFKQHFSQHTASQLFQNLETGQISEADFFEAFRTATASNITNEQIINAWNAMLGAIPKDRLVWLQEVSGRYNTYLFSNTNSIHYTGFINVFKRSIGQQSFDSYFKKAYYSHNLGLRKPNKEAFLKIIEIEKLVPEESLFIDDTLINIEGAQQAGLQTIHLHQPKTVLNLNL